MKRLLLSAAACVVVMTAGAQAQIENWIERIDPERAAAGEIHLGLFIDGEQDGFMRLGWQTQEDRIELFDRTMWASPEIYETYEAQINRADLKARQVDIRFHQQAAYFAISAEFDGSGVSGSRALIRPGMDRAEQPIDMALPDGTIPRAAFFLLTAIAPLELGDSVELTWYSPMSNAVETVTVSAVEDVTIETPAGSFHTRKLEQRGGSPSNDVFVDLESGRVVRIDVGGQPMQFLALPAAQ